MKCYCNRKSRLKFLKSGNMLRALRARGNFLRVALEKFESTSRSSKNARRAPLWVRDGKSGRRSFHRAFEWIAGSVLGERLALLRNIYICIYISRPNPYKPMQKQRFGGGARVRSVLLCILGGPWAPMAAGCPAPRAPATPRISAKVRRPRHGSRAKCAGHATDLGQSASATPRISAKVRRGAAGRAARWGAWNCQRNQKWRYVFRRVSWMYMARKRAVFAVVRPL